MRLILFLLFNLIFSTPLWCTTHEVPQGVRALGMGEAFVSVADDGTCVMWNPAGTPLVVYPELYLMYQDLYSSGVKNHTFNLLLPFHESFGPIGAHGIGANWTRIAFRDTELEYAKDDIMISYGFNFKFLKPLSLGFAIKYIESEVKVDNRTMDSDTREDINFGALLHLGEDVKIGVAGYNLLEIPNYRAGISWKPLDECMFMLEVDDRVHLGVEWWINRYFGVRGGLQRDIQSDEPPTLSCGFSFKYEDASIGYNFVQFDYAYLLPPTLKGTNYFSLRVPFDLFWKYKESVIKVEGQPIISDLYIGIAEYYRTHTFGSIRLRNISKVPLDVVVSIFIKELMNEECQVGLASISPGETKSIPLRGLIIDPQRALHATDGLKRAKLSIKYQLDGRPVTKELVQDFNLRSRYRVDFKEPLQLAAFVTPEDEPIAQFSRVILGKYLGRALDEKKILSEALYNAVLLYEALSSLGVSYQSDPSATSYFGDYLLYPRETLMQGRGDCDDLVVLYSSCLENLGVRTAIVDIPPYAEQRGHVMVLLDTQIKPHFGERLSLDPQLYIEKGDSLYIPIEVTMLGTSPFLDAWMRGVKVYRRALAAGDITVIDVAKVWHEFGFKPFDIYKKLGYKRLEDFPFRRLEEKMFQTLSRFRQKREEEFQTLISEFNKILKEEDAFSLKKRIGVVCYKYGEYGRAIEVFREIVEENPSDIEAYLYLGDCYFMKQRLHEAATCYRTILEKAMNEEKIAEVYWRLGLLYWSEGEIEQAKKEFRRAAELNPRFGVEYDKFRGERGERVELESYLLLPIE